ncbi:MAG TPA: hypothetical protein VJ201_02320 [Candidatus Babeliales bacterium]|nr:hypothetical protein [Candidatus Babeliales bacterium]
MKKAVILSCFILHFFEFFILDAFGQRKIVVRKVIHAQHPKKPKKLLDRCKIEWLKEPIERPEYITVFIHGSRVIPHRLIAPSFFHCTSGLHKVSDLGCWYYYPKFASRLHIVDPKRFPLHTFYTYCWSGDFGFEKRERAAKTLYDLLVKEVKVYKKKYKKRPKLRIIGHSHGVSVALNLAKVKDKNDGIVFDEMFFFGGPVQVATAHLALDSSIKKIYSFYSPFDLLQRIDPQGLYGYTKKNKLKTPIFSERCFKPHPKILQVRLKYNGHGVVHLEYLSYHFLYVLPTLMDAMDSWQELNNPQENIEYLLKVLTK